MQLEMKWRGNHLIRTPGSIHTPPANDACFLIAVSLVSMERFIAFTSSRCTMPCEMLPLRSEQNSCVTCVFQEYSQGQHRQIIKGRDNPESIPGPRTTLDRPVGSLGTVSSRV